MIFVVLMQPTRNIPVVSQYVVHITDNTIFICTFEYLLMVQEANYRRHIRSCVYGTPM